ncbi:MAG: hypothetical protein ABJB86_13275 [Bacteroidota bacterium]
MYSNKKWTLILFFLASFFVTIKLAAQDAKDTISDNVKVKGKYSFVVYAGGGLFQYMSSVGSSGTGINTSIVRLHPTGTFRVMWFPDHRLRVGIETGYNDFYSYKLKSGNTTGKVLLTGIPLLVVWSMAITKRINVYAGIGSYLLTTHLNYNGKVESKTSGLGLNGSVNYVQPISSKFGISAELKWTEVTQTRDYGLSAQLMLAWKFLEW